MNNIPTADISAKKHSDAAAQPLSAALFCNAYVNIRTALWNCAHWVSVVRLHVLMNYVIRAM
jgi:hypothetical protein